MKTPWYKEASYIYSTVPDADGTTFIEFRFPNAVTEPMIFMTWLYKIKDGEVIGKNLEAEMLQCYIDRDIS